MPAELFVDSDEGEDFEDNSDGGDSEKDDSPEDNQNDSMELEANEDVGGKKRKKGNKKEGGRSKKLKKLGPKQKGSRNEAKLSAEEIKELTAKEYAQYSNLYNVQIQEVLNEASISEKRKGELLTWFKGFKKSVGKIKKSKAFPMQSYQQVLDPIKWPLPEQIFSKKTEWAISHSFKWLPPSSVDLRGSWAVDTMLNKITSCDVFLEMPYDYLVKSDFLNHKYHVKRAFYLAYLAKKLSKQGNALKFTLHNGEPLKPVLSLQVHKVEILIHAVPPKDFFKVAKFTCEKNNLRYGHFFGKNKSDDEPETSTQHYNFTLLEDSLVAETQDELSAFLQNRPQFQDAIKLLKIWLTQRGLSKGYGGFSGFLATQFIRFLHKKGNVAESMTSFQLLRVFFISIIQIDLIENGISFNPDADLKSSHMQWDILFLDSTGILNYAANLSKYAFKRVQQEARSALAIIDGGNVAGFLALFVTPVKFMANFDHVVRFLNLDKLLSCLRKSSENDPPFLNHSGFVYPVAISTIGSIMERCLGSRISMLDAEIPEPVKWGANEHPPSHAITSIRFGVSIHREVSQKLIEKCESSSEHEIEQFKEFWGEKSELRRFKDGTLLESVVVDNLTGLGKKRICYQMLNYIFQRHLKFHLLENDYIDKQIETVVEKQYLKIKPPKTKGQVKKIYLHGKLAKRKSVHVSEEMELLSLDEVHRLASASFDDLSKILRLLEELPLSISTVQGSSAVLRFSNVQPTPPQTFALSKFLTEVNPNHKTTTLKQVKNSEDEEFTSSIVSKLPKYVEPIGVIIHLETSGQWPDDLKAIERLKCAFLLKIGELLTNKFGLTVQPYPRHLDVLKDGFVFRIRITYFRELTLLRQLNGPDGVVRLRDNPESLRLEKEALILPQLTSTLHSFHLQFEAFGKTCQIAKRWISSQLLIVSPLEYCRNHENPDCRMTEESIELLVAYLFLNYAPHLFFPSEAHVGFQRFLYFMANTNFHAVPIIANFNDKLDQQDIAAAELAFVKNRTTLPPLFIVTPFDDKSSVWTRHLSPVILHRIQLLAKQALVVMEDCFARNLAAETELLKIFHPDTSQFDVIIRLKNQTNPRFFQSKDSISTPLRFQEYQKKLDEVIPVVEFDPVQIYLQELRSTFGHMGMFLHDLYGGSFIAVVWKPDIFKSTGFTTSTVKGRQLGKDAKSVVTNVSGILESFQAMGKGIVDKVETQSERWKFDE